MLQNVACVLVYFNDGSCLCLLRPHHSKVEAKVNKAQRQYLLQEQLKLIKKELGLEVSGNL